MKHTLYTLIALALFIACKTNQNETSNQSSETKNIAYNSEEGVATRQTQQPLWSKDATIYEVNVRQHSPEGTLHAVTKDLPRLRNMGIDIIWLMPVQPISEKNRKATGELHVEEIESIEEQKKYLGSYYSIANYTAIHPDYGTMKDFETLVSTAHNLGMKVILDWVANHTGWDHKWISSFPDYYTQKDGKITDPINDNGESWGWTDVADLNFENEEMRKAMINEMRFWIKEQNIDGFRCDVAHSVPVDFWEQAVNQLKSDKQDIFMLAEAESPSLAGIFNMSYTWELHHNLGEIAQGKLPASRFKEDYERFVKKFGTSHYPMLFTTNHDENSWKGSVFERYGDSHQAAAVASFTVGGMPLMYSGQEAALNKRLRFFEKDTIDWGNYSLQDFYTKLLTLKKENIALHNGDFGAQPTFLNSNNEHIIFFKKSKDKNEITVAVNLTDNEQTFTIEQSISGQIALGDATIQNKLVVLPKHGYAIWVNNASN